VLLAHARRNNALCSYPIEGPCPAQKWTDNLFSSPSVLEGFHLEQVKNVVPEVADLTRDQPVGQEDRVEAEDGEVGNRQELELL